MAMLATAVRRPLPKTNWHGKGRMRIRPSATTEPEDIPDFRPCGSELRNVPVSALQDGNLSAVLAQGMGFLRIGGQRVYTLGEDLHHKIDDVLDGQYADGLACPIDDRDMPIAVHAHLVQSERHAGAGAESLGLGGHHRFDLPARVAFSKDDLAQH